MAPSRRLATAATARGMPAVPHRLKLDILLPPLDHPEELPGTVPETGDQVAFQTATGTPWRLMGPEGGRFRWKAVSHGAVSMETKDEVRTILKAYSDKHGIPLKGGGAVRLALRRGPHWISFSGGISSVEETGKRTAVQAEPVDAGSASNPLPASAATSTLPGAGSLDLPEVVSLRILGFCEQWFEFTSLATTESAWLASALSAPLSGFRKQLCRELCLPCVIRRWHPGDEELQLATGLPSIDWVEFAVRQRRLQKALEGRYFGALALQSLFAHAREDDFDWSRQHQIFAELTAMSAQGNSCASASQQVFADEEELPEWGGGYEWLVLDNNEPLDAALWRAFAPGCGDAQERSSARRERKNSGSRARVDSGFVEPDCPEERWEDGDCFCGVRGDHDFRPAVDPAFLSLSSLAVLLVPRAGSRSPRALFWAPRLFAPCAWMFPKGDAAHARLATCLDHWAEFRADATVAALTLGRNLERAVTFSSIEELLAATRDSREQPAAAPEGGGSRKQRRKERKEKPTFNDPRNKCSGRNPNGLNYFVPRKVTVKATPGKLPAGAVPLPDSLLRCDVRSDVEKFLEEHKPTKREAERLQVYVHRDENSERAEDPWRQDLLQDAQRLEQRRALSQESILEIARKWRCLCGKWLLFVPEWRIDDLMAAACRRLQEGSLQGCWALTVSPPGTWGTDQGRFMLAAHCSDFSNVRQTMAVGKCLRAAAREGLRCPAGDWGELRDDPFAAKGKKVCLAFKPEVFSLLGLHRNNPYGIKTTLYTIDL